MKTRFIKRGSAGYYRNRRDINYSNFLDADMLMDISDFEGWRISSEYLDIRQKSGIQRMEYMRVPYTANAAGILYNRICLKKMDGRSLKPGMSFLNFLIPFGHPDSNAYFVFWISGCLDLSGAWNAMACLIWLPDVCVWR